VINGLHLLLYSQDAAADRTFLRDVLGWPFVEDEPGWLIFKTPVSELGVHPTDGPPVTELHLLCDDIQATVAELSAKGVPVGEVSERSYGTVTTVTLPSGATLGLYQPKHALAIDL
jgi:catechol 2,3-dioxygenase-like lactoylglutathione lyase family enzyme